MDREKIDRINFLARKSKNEGLSPEEKEEQLNLRNEYRAFMMRGFMATAANTYVVDENGNKKRLVKGDNNE